MIITNVMHARHVKLTCPKGTSLAKIIGKLKKDMNEVHVEMSKEELHTAIIYSKNGKDTNQIAQEVRTVTGNYF